MAMAHPFSHWFGDNVEVQSGPTVSVIIPFFNAEHYLQQAVESVFAQTFDDWELILVDDASSDGSSELAASYAAQYPEKVRVLEHQQRANRGVAASRDLGLKHARAPLLALLDADDIWVDSKLDEQVAIMNTNPDVGMVIGETVRWYSWTSGGVHRDHDYTYGSCESKNRIYHPPELLALLYPLGDGRPPSISGLMIRTEKVKAVGGFASEITSIYEDQAFLVRVYRSAPVYVANACWDYYRQHPLSAVARAHQNAQYRIVRRQFLGWLGGYLQSTAVTDPAVTRAFDEADWYFRHSVLGPLWSEMKKFASRPVDHMRFRLSWLSRQVLRRYLSRQRYLRTLSKLTLTRQHRRVLAAIALTQPVGQLEIENVIPGDATKIVYSLLALKMIAVAPGSIPSEAAPTFVTTPGFLDFYGIETLESLSGIEAPEFTNIRARL